MGQIERLLMSPPFSASFKRLALSNLLAQSAEQLSLAAVPIVAVLLLKAGPGEIGLLASIQSLPFLLLAMPLGLLADRTSRTRLMALAEALRAMPASSPWLAKAGTAGTQATSAMERTVRIMFSA